MKIEAVFFDVGDTLLFDDPPVDVRVQRTLGAIGIDIQASRLSPAMRMVETYVLGQYILGNDTASEEIMRESARIICHDLDIPDFADSKWSEFRDTYLSMPFSRILHPMAIDLIADIKCKGTKVGVISDWDESLPKILEGVHLLQLFDSLSISHFVGVTKPHPDIFLDALQKTGVQPDRALHVGDFYELDVAGAQSVGMRAILFDWRGRLDLPSVPCARAFEELAPIISALTGQSYD